MYASISGFGQTGPYADRPGYDLVAQAMSGVMSITGEPDGRPVKSGIPVADLGSGLFCAIGILAAWICQPADGCRTAGGDVAVRVRAGAGRLGVDGILGHRRGAAEARFGEPDVRAVPGAGDQGRLRHGGREQRPPLAATVRRPRSRAPGSRTRGSCTNVDRMAHRPELAAVLEERLAQRTTAEWVDLLLAAGVPAGPIQDYRQVLEDDPHVKARGMIEHVAHPVEGVVPVLASPLRINGRRPPVRRAPPLLGEHNDEVLDHRPSRPVSIADAVPLDEGNVEVHRSRGHPARGPEEPSAQERAHLAHVRPAAGRLRRGGCRRDAAGGGPARSGDAFAAGTDIRQFVDFHGGADGVAYERRIARVLSRLLDLRVPLVGVVTGPAVGAGLALAAVCDLLRGDP